MTPWTPLIAQVPTQKDALRDWGQAPTAIQVARVNATGDVRHRARVEATRAALTHALGGLETSDGRRQALALLRVDLFLRGRRRCHWSSRLGTGRWNADDAAAWRAAAVTLAAELFADVGDPTVWDFCMACEEMGSTEDERLIVIYCFEQVQRACAGTGSWQEVQQSTDVVLWLWALELLAKTVVDPRACELLSKLELMPTTMMADAAEAA